MQTSKSIQQKFIEGEALNAYKQAKGTLTTPGAPAVRGYQRSQRLSKVPKAVR